LIVTKLHLSSTCWLLTQLPDSVAVETSDTAAIVSTTVVQGAIQRERNCTTLRRDSWGKSWTCSGI